MILDAKPSLASGEVLSPDGVRLRIRSRISDPSLPALVFINAIGIPAEIFEPLMAWFPAEEYNLATWEIRGCRAGAREFDAMDCAFDAHLRDLGAVAAELGLREMHLVGWSTGAAIALKAAASDPRVRTVTLISGTYSSRRLPGTRFFNNMKAIGANWDKGRPFLAGLHRTVFAKGRGEAPAEGAGGEATIMGQRVPSEVAGLIGFPFRDPDSFFAYCKLSVHWEREKCEDFAARVRQPCLFVCGRLDSVSNNAISQQLNRELPGSAYAEVEDGTHYFFIDRGGTAADLIKRHVGWGASGDRATAAAAEEAVP